MAKWKLIDHVQEGDILHADFIDEKFGQVVDLVLGDKIQIGMHGYAYRITGDMEPEWWKLYRLNAEGEYYLVGSSDNEAQDERPGITLQFNDEVWNPVEIYDELSKYFPDERAADLDDAQFDMFYDKAIEYIGYDLTDEQHSQIMDDPEYAEASAEEVFEYAMGTFIDEEYNESTVAEGKWDIEGEVDEDEFIEARQCYMCDGNLRPHKLGGLQCDRCGETVSQATVDRVDNRNEAFDNVDTKDYSNSEVLFQEIFTLLNGPDRDIHLENLSLLLPEDMNQQEQAKHYIWRIVDNISTEVLQAYLEDPNMMTITENEDWTDMPEVYFLIKDIAEGVHEELTARGFDITLDQIQAELEQLYGDKDIPELKEVVADPDTYTRKVMSLAGMITRDLRNESTLNELNLSVNPEAEAENPAATQAVKDAITKYIKDNGLAGKDGNVEVFGNYVQAGPNKYRIKAKEKVAIDANGQESTEVEYELERMDD